MSNTISNDLIQKYLFVNSDRIFKQIVKTPSNRPVPDTKTKLLNNEILQNVVSNKDAAKLLSRQRELISANMAPSSDSAFELFADPRDKNFLINSGYIISHNLLYSKNGGKYTFNLDEINKTANADPDGYGGRFVFHKINIANRARDAFTAKSNYLVTIHIAFSFFDDLKENLINGKNIFNPEENKKFSLWNLLYPAYDRNTPSTIGSRNEQRDGSGLILNQVLNISPGSTSYFKETKNSISSTEIHKNYHLTYYKHSINIFKSQEPAFKSFDSELIIEYVSYEADETINQNKDINTPNLNNNLYSLLNKENATNNIFFSSSPLGSQVTKEMQKAQNKGDNSIRKKSAFQAFTDFIKEYNNQLEKLQRGVECKKAGKTVSGDIDISPNLSLEDFKKEVDKKTSQINEAIQKLKEEFSVYLFRYIINNLDIYEFEIDSNELIKYQNSVWFDAALKSFSGNFSTAAAAGAILGPKGVLAAELANAANAVYQGVSAKGEVSERGAALTRPSFTGTVRKIFSKGEDNYADFITGRNKEVESKILLNAAKGVGSITAVGAAAVSTPVLVAGAGTAAAAGASGYDVLGALGGAVQSVGDLFNPEEAAQRQYEESRRDASTEGVSKALAGLEEQYRTINDENQIIKARFTLFGELIDIIPKDENVSVLIGGKTIPIDTNYNSIFLNYYYIPIDYFKLLNFLNEKIVKNYTLSYSSEVFLRELVDTFLKDATITEGYPSTAIKEIIPTHITTNVNLLDGASKAYNEFINNCEKNTLIDDNFNKLKTNFILSKNLNPRKGKKQLKKLYTIVGNEEVKYHNFYDEYREWKKQNYSAQADTTVLFQEFIIKKYCMPCLRTKPTDIYGSILINKNLTFSRKDNPNLVVGQMIDNSGFSRLPYVISGAFKPYIFFFLDVASLMFVAPPDKRNGKLEMVDQFGFSGLYLIKNSSFEYNFQLMDNNDAPIIPNESARCNLEGILITYGDGYKPLSQQQPSTIEQPVACNVEEQPK